MKPHQPKFGAIRERLKCLPGELAMIEDEIAYRNQCEVVRLRAVELAKALEGVGVAMTADWCKAAWRHNSLPAVYHFRNVPPGPEKDRASAALTEWLSESNRLAAFWDNLQRITPAGSQPPDVVVCSPPQTLQS